MDNFYVTLPSNASMGYYPENTQSNWITIMNPPIELTGNWEIGLSEIHIPNKWENINSTNNTFEVSYLNQTRNNILVEYPADIKFLNPPGVKDFFDKNSITIEFTKEKSITKAEFFQK